MADLRLERRSLHDALLEPMREMIVTGELAPGGRINEPALCDRFGVSRTPLREALKVLASEGLVDLLPNRGAQVSPLRPGEIAETFPVIAALEALAGEAACAHATAAEIVEIAALHTEMVACHAAGDLPEYFRLNQRIHEAIMAAARNGVLAATHRALSLRIRRARYAANLSPDRWAQAVGEHGAILAALQARDGARLGALLRAHMLAKGRAVLERLEEG
ncbi:MAG: GntR family transcriptional regulator [Gemmobacter sp.]